MSEEKRCGSCVWHHDLFGTNEAEGVANCLARSYPEVEEVLSTREALCDLPHMYVKRKGVDDERKEEAGPKAA